MTILGLDLGGTKLASALFSESGRVIEKDTIALEHREGGQVGLLMAGVVRRYLASGSAVGGIGISVPGIAFADTGRVWAPNIPGWEQYPLLDEMRAVAGDIPVVIDNDRACCILGEQWQGGARGCRHAIYLSVGTGIGAGILADGNILRGAHDIAGAVGWMALQHPYQEKYKAFGCFEYYASGDGIARLTLDMMDDDYAYAGMLRARPRETLTAHHVFHAFEQRDPLAKKVMDACVTYWGMAAANLISIFNPEKLLFGGGVFGPAIAFLPQIRAEASRWAQPVSMQRVTFEASSLQGDAAIVGAAFVASLATKSAT